jgi:hypothetical protein
MLETGLADGGLASDRFAMAPDRGWLDTGEDTGGGLAGGGLAGAMLAAGEVAAGLGAAFACARPLSSAGSGIRVPSTLLMARAV